MTLLKNSPVEFLVPQMQRHYPRGNTIAMVLRTVAAGDKDLGIGGDVTETVTTLDPEPFINAMNIEAVRRSNGAFRYSDQKMTVARETMTELQALDLHTEFSVNGDRYEILAVTPGPSAWEFAIRRKTATPVTP